MKKGFQIAIVILTVILLGSLREVLFVSLNNQIAFIKGQLESNYLVSYFSFLENFSLNELSLFKWIFTVIFTIFFWVIGYWVLKRIFGHPLAAKYYSGLYILFIGLAGLIYLIGAIFHLDKLGYELARGMMGGLQSPLPLIILLPALLLKKDR